MNQPRKPKDGEDRCSATGELTPNSIWQCKWVIGHEGDHQFERIGWRNK